jgi:pyruvate dehydrogenase E1 component alpha subunit
MVCENNLYSSHLHIEQRRLRDNLDQAGEFHGVPGMRVDGNDLLEVYRAARVAVGRARSGLGPTLIECRTFRWRGHVGASSDLDVGVRRSGELAEWLDRDPVARLEAHLSGINFDAELQTIEHEMQVALEAARRAPLPDGSRLLEHVWGETACVN